MKASFFILSFFPWERVYAFNKQIAPVSESLITFISLQLQTKIVKQTKRGTKHKTMYKCTICLKIFQKPSQLMRHIRVHTGEKPFKVNALWKKIIDDNILNNSFIHILFLVQCTICNRAFTQKSSLQIHTWQHKGIRPHTCSLCNAKFSQKGLRKLVIYIIPNVSELII